VSAYWRVGAGRTRAAPLPDGTYRTYGTNRSLTHRSHESYNSHPVTEPHAHADTPIRRYAVTHSQDLPISDLRDILLNRGSFDRTVEQTP
jgi:hypothetical protein